MSRRLVSPLLLAYGLLAFTFAISATPPAPAASTPPGHASVVSKPVKPPKAPAKPVKLIDINSASAEQLKMLPGIGDAEAARIVAGRPYLSKADLVPKAGLPEGTFLAIKRQVIAKQTAKPKPKA